jgi:type IV pilus assembly protein PilA
MFCANCGTANPDAGKFCNRCGAPLATQLIVPPSSPEAYAEPQKPSGKALASLICGIFFFVLPSAIAAVILGHISLSEIRKSAGRLAGRGNAVTGLVLGYLGVAAIPIILILAAVAIPNILRARIVADEASAIGALRTINEAEVKYASSYKNGFTPSLDALGGTDYQPSNCDNPLLIDSSLANGTEYGYAFTYVALNAGGRAPVARTTATPAEGCTEAGMPRYELTADPVHRGATGGRSFYTDQTGIIRYETNNAASATSPPLQ